MPRHLGRQRRRRIDLYMRTAERQDPMASATTPSFVCPRCAKQSWNPVDAEQGYCGSCKDWTRV